MGAPLGYDRAYNLQIVVKLLHGHCCATHPFDPSGPPQPFKDRITAGRTIMLPVTAAAYVLWTNAEV